MDCREPPHGNVDACIQSALPLRQLTSVNTIDICEGLESGWAQMARALRLQFEGALYRLCARGNRRERIFELLTILTKKGVERLGAFLFRSR